MKKSKLGLVMTSLLLLAGASCSGRTNTRETSSHEEEASEEQVSSEKKDAASDFKLEEIDGGVSLTLGDESNKGFIENPKDIYTIPETITFNNKECTVKEFVAGPVMPLRPVILPKTLTSIDFSQLGSSHDLINYEYFYEGSIEELNKITITTNTTNEHFTYEGYGTNGYLANVYDIQNYPCIFSYGTSASSAEENYWHYDENKNPVPTLKDSTETSGELKRYTKLSKAGNVKVTNIGSFSFYVNRNSLAACYGNQSETMLKPAESMTFSGLSAGDYFALCPFGQAKFEIN